MVTLARRELVQSAPGPSKEALPKSILTLGIYKFPLAFCRTAEPFSELTEWSISWKSSGTLLLMDLSIIIVRHVLVLMGKGSPERSEVHAFSPERSDSV